MAPVAGSRESVDVVIVGAGISGIGAALGIVAAAVLDYETDTRLDTDARAMMIRALRGARQDSMGLDVVIYFPTEKAEVL